MRQWIVRHEPSYETMFQWATLALFVIFVLNACTQLGLEKPQTPDQRIAAAYATADAINRSATSLLKAQRITSQDAQHVLDSTRTARTGIDLARSIGPIDPKAADAKIRTQIAILNALNLYLQQKEKP